MSFSVATTETADDFTLEYGDRSNILRCGGDAVVFYLPVSVFGLRLHGEF